LRFLESLGSLAVFFCGLLEHPEVIIVSVGPALGSDLDGGIGEGNGGDGNGDPAGRLEVGGALRSTFLECRFTPGVVVKTEFGVMDFLFAEEGFVGGLESSERSFLPGGFNRKGIDLSIPASGGLLEFEVFVFEVGDAVIAFEEGDGVAWWGSVAFEVFEFAG